MGYKRGEAHRKSKQKSHAREVGSHRQAKLELYRIHMHISQVNSLPSTRSYESQRVGG